MTTTHWRSLEALAPVCGAHLLAGRDSMTLLRSEVTCAACLERPVKARDRLAALIARGTVVAVHGSSRGCDECADHPSVLDGLRRCPKAKYVLANRAALGGWCGQHILRVAENRPERPLR